MDLKVIATTCIGYNADKSEFDDFSGKSAGVCYMASTFDDLISEDKSKTAKRVMMTKSNGHHSVYDHETISMYLSDVPKIVAMVLNNEHQYTTSEKSARYTKMVMTEKEKAAAGYLYNANYDEEILNEISRCNDLCHEFNQIKPSDREAQGEILKQILGTMGE